MKSKDQRPATWSKRVLKLNDDHGWTAKPGNKIFVADGGAVRFDIPGDWIVEPGTDSIKFHDRQPPDDDCLLQVSVLHLRPDINWSELLLPKLLLDVTVDDSRGVLARGEVTHVRRSDLELAWYEARFMDPVERREACSRLCLARGSNVQPFITMDFWPEHTARFDPVWDEVLNSLRLGDYVPDPTRRIFH